MAKVPYWVEEDDPRLVVKVDREALESVLRAAQGGEHWAYYGDESVVGEYYRAAIKVVSDAYVEGVIGEEG